MTAYEIWRASPAHATHDYDEWLEEVVPKLARWCEGMIEGLQHVADESDDLRDHALGSLTDPEGGEDGWIIPEEFRRLVRD